MRLAARISKLEQAGAVGRMIIVCAGCGEHADALRDHAVEPRPIDLVVIINKPLPIPSWVRIDGSEKRGVSA